MSRHLLANLASACLGAAAALPLAALGSQGVGIASPAAGEVELMLAYIDPGVAGFVIVSILGFLSSVGYLARSYIGRVKERLFGRGGTDTAATDDESSAEGDADGETANC